MNSDDATLTAPIEAASFRWRTDLLALALFTVLTLIMTYPLVLRPHREVLGSPGDSLVPVWNMWWTRHAIVEQHQWPFFGDAILRPFPIPFLHRSHNFYYGLLYCIGGFVIPNPILWTNLSIWSSFIIAAYATFLLARYLTGNVQASIIAAVAFSYCSFRMNRAGGHLNILSHEYVPLYLYFLIRGVRENQAIYYLGAAACAAISLWCEYYSALYVVIFSLLFVATGSLFKCYAYKQIVLFPLRKWPALLLLVALTAPFLWGLYVTVTRYEVVPAGGHRFYSAIPSFYLIPSAYHTLLGRWLYPLYYYSPNGNPVESLVFIGYCALVLALYGLVRARPYAPYQKFFFLAALVFFILSLGPIFRVELLGSKWNISLPYKYIQDAGLLKDFRVPARLSVMAVFCISILAAYGLKSLMERTASERYRWASTAAIVILILVENLHAPWTYHYDLKDPSVLPTALAKEIRDDPGQGAVIQFPFYASDYRSCWLQPFYNKPMLTGILSRTAPGMIEYYNQLDLSGWFALDPSAPGNGPDPLAIADRNTVLDPTFRGVITKMQPDWTPQDVRRVCYFFDLRYIIIPPLSFAPDLHKQIRKGLLPLEKESSTPDAWLGFLKSGPDPFPIHIDGGSAVANCFFVSNFSIPEGGARWMMKTSSTLAIRIPAAEDLSMKLVLGAPAHLQDRRQSVKIFLNGSFLEEVKFSLLWNVFNVRIPAGNLVEGYNFIRLVPQIAESPASLKYNDDRRLLTAMVGPIDIVRLQNPK